MKPIAQYLRALRRMLAIGVLAALPGTGYYLLYGWPTPATTQAAETLPTITWSAAQAQQVLWIDAWPTGSGPTGAIPLRLAQWESDLPAVLQAWQPGQSVVVFCPAHTCNQAQSVAQRLRQETTGTGMDIYVLAGGWPPEGARP